jgi:hypothetical protein
MAAVGAEEKANPDAILRLLAAQESGFFRSILDKCAKIGLSPCFLSPILWLDIHRSRLDYAFC